jgi:alkyldihydroxyacetonephosphate synthase
VSLAIDRTSMLVDVEAESTIEALETSLAIDGFTLALASDVDRAATIRDWLATGAPGARSAFADPADHLVAGLEATLLNGERLVVRPSPRRAVGPDLIALVVGAQGRFARIDRATLRVHPLSAPRPCDPLPADLDLDPPLSAGESRLVDAIAIAFGATTTSR